MVTKRSLLPTSSATSIYLNFDGHSLFIPHLLSTHANSDKWRKVKNHAKFFLQAQIAHRASSSNSSSKKDQKKRKTEFSQGCNFFFKKSMHNFWRNTRLLIALLDSKSKVFECLHSVKGKKHH